MTEWSKIEEWVFNVIGKNNPNLNWFSPCPYARSAIIKKEVEVVLISGEFDMDISLLLSTKKVILFVDIDDREYEELKYIQECFSEKYQEYVMLIGHPKRPFYLSGILTTYPNHPILFVQKKDELKKASDVLMEAGYYRFWTKDQFDEVVNNKMRR